jgi:hypothetical protein
MENATMRQWWMNRAALAGLIVLAACDDKTRSSNQFPGAFPPGYVAPASTENLLLVDHPEYLNWSRFPVGIVVVRKKEVFNDLGTVRVMTTLRLAEKTADKIVVESQVTVDRAGQPLIENPPLSIEFPATFRLPAGMKLEQFSLPSLKAKSAGEETRQASGRDYTTQLFTWDEVNETGPMRVKLWRSDEIPGRMLRQEINGHMHTSVEEIVEISQTAVVAPFSS